MLKDKRTAMVGTLVLALFLLSLTLTNPGKVLAVAVDAFLKIDGVEGESRDDKHKNWIHVINWSFGESEPAVGSRSTGGQRSREVSFQDFKFTMHTNKASPKLFQNCAEGKHLKDAKLAVRRSGKDQAEFFEIWLQDVVVSSFMHMGRSGPDTYPMEEIMFKFSKITISYKPTKADGSLGGSEVGGWDLSKNKPQ